MLCEERFAELVEEFAGRPGVQRPTGGRSFGASALTVDGSIFAMLKDGDLVVKLPAHRVTALIASGEGGPFGGGKRQPMRQWVTIRDHDTWSALAAEALDTVRGARSRS